MTTRPVDHRGFPVPWFVTQKTPEGLWDFTVVTRERVAEALKHEKCWVSGEKLGKFKSFVVGPMCTINRIAADPPVKPNLGEWSAAVCPFLSRPLAKRPEKHIENDATPGIAVPDNPGVCAVWVTKKFHYQTRGSAAGLMNIGEPESVKWFTYGREATKEERVEGFNRGAKKLLGMAAQDGDESIDFCHTLIEKARVFL